MFHALSFAFFTELKEIATSWYKLALISLLPLTAFAFLATVFDQGVAFKLPIVVVDHDKSQLSRKLLFNINASPTLAIKYKVDSTKEALKLMQTGNAYALVEVPQDFQRDVSLQTHPKVTSMINTQYILIGKIVKSALFKSVAASAGEVEYVQHLQHTQSSSASLHKITPIKLQVTAFFNTYNNYFLFLVSALLPSVWQIFIVITTIVSFGSLFKAKKEQEFFAGEYIAMKMLGKLLPYTIAYTLLGVGFLVYIYGVKGWAFEGSFTLMVFAVFLTVVAYQVIALFLFVISFDYARTLSLGAAYTAPAFAFLGVTFPASDMNFFASFWRDMLPISYYMELQISQANYGVNVLLEVEKLGSIALFILLAIPVFFRFRARLAS